MRGAIAVLGFALLGQQALAADGAQSRAIGYSPDAHYFAFEQYGTQDGSGYGYADIFVLDTTTNQWAKGSPVRVLDESESSSVNQAISKAEAQAAPLLKSLNISAAYETLAYSPFTEIGGDRRAITFARYYDSLGNQENYKATGSYQLQAKDVHLPAPADCSAEDGYSYVGLELTLKNLQNAKSASIYTDKAIPTSRQCPHAYDIEAIYAPATEGLTREPLIALIGVYSRGFEGSDRRLIAVPFELIE